ncbi:hypothetical protein ACIBSV_50020 [Embleya sp. NPDC050154]|uniref:hypothetical protein n=1 Tax=Embleya sp. NPDC050154 TaxID=3363988 RepID=UPI0037A64E15
MGVHGPGQRHQTFAEFVVGEHVPGQSQDQAVAGFAGGGAQVLRGDVVEEVVGVSGGVAGRGGGFGEGRDGGGRRPAR